MRKIKLKKNYDFQDFIKIIADSNRFRILQLIMHREVCVCKIYEELHLSQNLVSHHLKMLKKYSLVNCRSDKNWKYYSANKPLIKAYFKEIENNLYKEKEKHFSNKC